MKQLPSYAPTHLRTSRGFTLVELLIYCGLTLIVVGLFGGIIITITRIQSQQTAVRQVAAEADFAMNVIKNDIRNSSFAETHDTWMSLITPSSSGEITIDSAAGTIREQMVSGGAFLPLTTNKVFVNALNFTTYASGSNKAIKIKFTISYNTTNPQQSATQTLETTVAPLKKTN